MKQYLILLHKERDVMTFAVPVSQAFLRDPSIIMGLRLTLLSTTAFRSPKD